MGIARRKAGSKVKCPNCSQLVMVPTDDPGESPIAAAPARAPAAVAAKSPAPPAPFPGLFEQNDFDELLRPRKVEMEAAPAPPAPGPGPGAAPAWSSPANYDVEPVSLNGQSLPGLGPVGFLVTPRRATLFVVVGVLLLGLAFGAGFWVGRYY